jgi:pyridoxal phosphate enzyme (YggS family)
VHPDDVRRHVESVRARIARACDRSGRSAEAVTLIAVTKGFGPEAVRAAVDAGIPDIGENRVQEAVTKKSALSGIEGVTWHMIGHLQTNKVKAAIATFDIIHSVDSLHLAQAISDRAPAEVPVFLEVNIAGEASKSGVPLDELPALHGQVSVLPGISVRGLMTVAPIGLAETELRPLFRRLRNSAEALGLEQLSMGMSDDFEVAIEEGATHVRVGRAIFGDRPL